MSISFSVSANGTAQHFLHDGVVAVLGKFSHVEADPVEAGVYFTYVGRSRQSFSITGLNSNREYDFLTSISTEVSYAAPVTFKTLPGCGDTLSFCYGAAVDGTTPTQQAAVDCACDAGQSIGVFVKGGVTEPDFDYLEIFESLDRNDDTELYRESGSHTGLIARSTTSTGVVSVWTTADEDWDCQTDKYSDMKITVSCWVDCAHQKDYWLAQGCACGGGDGAVDEMGSRRWCEAQKVLWTTAGCDAQCPAQ